jgi:nitrogen-specific signal transduction histidine kinase
MVRPIIFAVAAPGYCGRSNETSGANPGLDIVRPSAVTHNDEVKLNSKPGETRFVASLPIQLQNVEEG